MEFIDFKYNAAALSGILVASIAERSFMTFYPEFYWSKNRGYPRISLSLTEYDVPHPMIMRIVMDDGKIKMDAFFIMSISCETMLVWKRLS